MSEIRWTPKLRERILPGSPGALKPEVREPNLAEFRGLWQKGFANCTPDRWKEGERFAKEPFGELCPAARARVDKILGNSDPGPSDPRVEAALGAMLGWTCDTLVDYWLSKAGLDFTLECMKTGCEWYPRDCSPVWLYVLEGNQLPSNTLLAVRRWVAAQPSCPALPEQEASLNWRCALAFIFPQYPDLAEACARESLALNPPGNARHLMGSLRQADLVEECWRLYANKAYSMTIETVVANLGFGSLGILERYAAVELIDLFPGAPAARSLVAVMSNSPESQAREALRKRPAEAIPALLEGAQTSTALRFLANVAIAYPEHAQAFSDRGGPAGEVLAQSLEYVNSPVVATEDLPQILLDPPWKGGLPKKAALPNVPPLSVPEDYPDKIEASPKPKLAALLERQTSFHYLSADGLLEVLRSQGLSMLPTLRNADNRNLLEALTSVNSPRVASVMLESFTKKSMRPRVLCWLRHYPRAAAFGLIPPAVQSKGGDTAQTMLRLLPHDVVAEVAQCYGKEAAQAVSAILAEDVLLAGLPAKIPALPAFWSGMRMPTVGGRRLSLEAGQVLGQMLAFTSVSHPYAGLGPALEALDPESRKQFGWNLFESWIEEGADPKEQWAMLALGLLGDDDTARQLTPLIRAWPGQNANARAVSALSVLTAIGTDVALMHLNGIAQKVKFKGLQDKAREKIAELAEARGLTAEELEDRLVPDLDLDSTGSRSLDFGRRKFQVGFDELLRPFVREKDGARLADLPKPAASDDAAAAAVATAIWKALKKDVKMLADIQISRLELAMTTRRSWTVEAFQLLFPRHPLMFHLARRLAWGLFDGDDLRTSFRVCEDGSLADCQDNGLALASDGNVRVLHPVEMDEPTLATWCSVFHDYELLQPFPQLDRPVPRSQSLLDIACAENVPFSKVLTLERRGWRRGMESGWATSLSKDLGGGQWAILALDPGLLVMDLQESGDQSVGPLELSDGQPVTNLHRVAHSELQVDLACLC